MSRLTEERKTELLATLPPRDVTIARARDYMRRADLTLAQFSKMLGYALSTLSLFLEERYEMVAGSDLGIRQKCEDLMRAHPVGIAFTASHGQLYETENVRQIRHWFEHCHEHRALAFIYGPPGSQKTFVLQHLVAEFNRRELSRETSRHRVYLVRASVDTQPRDLIAKMCVEAGAATGGSLQRCMAGLRHKLRDAKALFVIDEAQLCGIRALEALRELHDTEPHLGVLLAGSHGLKTFFDQRAAELEQWNSRLDAGIELSGVSDACARAIIELECGDLDRDQVDQLINGSRVQDIYSRDRSRTYLNMRRLFKNITALRRLAAEATEATA